jgi:AcrR family transcriptional regulator
VVTSNDGERLTRTEAAAQARARLLSSGVEIAEEQPVNTGLDHIRVSDVAKRVGMTTGAIYHHWDSQDAYREELMDVLLEPIQLQNPELIEGVINLVLEGKLTLGQVIALATWDNVTQLEQHPRFAVQLGFWTRRDDPEIRSRLQRSFAKRGATNEASMSVLLEAFGRRVKPPLTMGDFVTAVSALAEGMVIRRGVDANAVPVGFPDIGDEEAAATLRELAGDRYPVDAGSAVGINLVARCAGILVEGMTEPLDDTKGAAGATTTS